MGLAIEMQYLKHRPNGLQQKKLEDTDMAAKTKKGKGLTKGKKLSGAKTLGTVTNLGGRGLSDK
jgi:hypothetical protein